jgi:RecA/RadA recombinase
MAPSTILDLKRLLEVTTRQRVKVEVNKCIPKLDEIKFLVGARKKRE